MTGRLYATVSIDNAEAVVFVFSDGDLIEYHIEAMYEHHIQAMYVHGNDRENAEPAGSGHANISRSFLAAVVDAIKLSCEVLIVGDDTAKDELVGFIREHGPPLASRVVGVVAMDQPTRAEVLAFARKFFERRHLVAP